MVNPNEKFILKIREEVPTQPIEVNIQSTGTTQEDQVFFPTEDAQMPSEKQLRRRKEEKRNAVHKEPPSITVSHC